jgi:hypothetical protein
MQAPAMQRGRYHRDRLRISFGHIASTRARIYRTCGFYAFRGANHKE